MREVEQIESQSDLMNLLFAPAPFECEALQNQMTDDSLPLMNIYAESKGSNETLVGDLPKFPTTSPTYHEEWKNLASISYDLQSVTDNKSILEFSEMWNVMFINFHVRLSRIKMNLKMMAVKMLKKVMCFEIFMILALFLIFNVRFS